VSKSILIPILNHEYKVVVCWGNLTHLRKTLLKYHYHEDHVTKSFIKEQTDNRRGVTFQEHRCYSVVWLNADLPFAEVMGTLAHEAVHAAEFTFQAINEDIIHSEIFAHSVGAIVREVVKSMKLNMVKEYLWN
jgi:hypothetical protein